MPSHNNLLLCTELGVCSRNVCLSNIPRRLRRYISAELDCIREFGKQTATMKLDEVSAFASLSELSHLF